MYGLLVRTKETRQPVDAEDPRLMTILVNVFIVLPTLIMIVLMLGLIATTLILGHQTANALEKAMKWKK